MDAIIVYKWLLQSTSERPIFRSELKFVCSTGEFDGIYHETNTPDDCPREEWSNFLQATRSESAGTTSVTGEIAKYFLGRRLEIRRERLLVTRLQLPKDVSHSGPRGSGGAFRKASRSTLQYQTSGAPGVHFSPDR